MSNIIKCVFGPRLLRIHDAGNGQGHNYEANGMESFADSVVKWIRFFKALSYWTSPVLLTILYRRNFFSVDGIVWTSKLVGGLLISYYVAVWIRGIGRWLNPEYLQFVSVLENAQIEFTPQNKRQLMNYDSEFGPWPVEFRWDDMSTKDRKPRKSIPMNSTSRALADSIRTLPCHILSYIAIHTFGRRMIFPGATCMQVLLGPMLNQGRAKLVEEKRGRRAKLLAEDGNEIDTMFLDRRNDGAYPHGNTLVVTSEGNAGFYEIGCMITPMDAGYSVLGWNHPGFGGSTVRACGFPHKAERIPGSHRAIDKFPAPEYGVPFPSQEHNAVDVVMQYAIHRLGFPPENIVFFAWSIGGYAATWAAMNYPDIKYVVLDATFDHIVPLALQKMPASWKSLVTLTVKKYMNLNNAELLTRYPGPILVIRRSRDEIITTEEPAVLKSNRGNNLLVILLQYRYPNLICEETIPILWEWLARQRNEQLAMWLEYGVEEDLCNSIFRSYVLENSNSFPMQIGEDMTRVEKIRLTLFLAHMYMTDFESTHGVPLPANMFKEPWTPQIDFED